MAHNPISQFERWLEEAKAHEQIIEPTAMNLASVGQDGKPSSRMVLLKEVSDAGFVFYTNFQSRKGQEILANPYVALCFYWMPLKKQVRVEGSVEQVSDAEADAYFASRSRAKRIGAWASQQSRPLSGKAELLKEVAKQTARFGMGDVPRPPHWSGWKVVPEHIEFWQEGEARIHDREVFMRSGDGWDTQRLYP